MTALALAAILGSAALHAAWNALLKRAPDHGAASAVIAGGAAAVTVVAAAFAGEWSVPRAGWPWVVAAGLVEAVYFVTLSRALTLLPLGTAYGLSRGAGLLIVWPLSVAMFGEALVTHEVAGAVLVAAGLFALATRAHSAAGLRAAAACAVTIGVYPVTYKGALAHGVSPFPLFAIALAIALPLQLAVLGPTRAGRLRRALASSPGALALAALLCAASFLLFLAALDVSHAGRITGLRNTSVLFAALFGRLAGERLTRRTALAMTGIAAGAMLLTV